MCSILRGATQISGQTANSITGRTTSRNGVELMSAITETEPGSEMVCILGFSARPRGLDDQPISGARRRFHVGERVRYVTFFYSHTPEDNPIGYMAVFEPIDKADKNRYAASQNYFVTLDCWEGLREHFALTSVTGPDKAGEGTKIPIAAPAKKPKRVAAKISATTLNARKLSRGKGARKDA
jgi:hypothetical protein